MTTQKRSFKIDPYAIHSLIKAQAGSLQKAVLEAVANSLDAGASSVKVNVSSKRVVIEDDGRGFSSEEELEKFFETFGFDHSKLDRKVGRFGVGRGQLFHFGKNLWTTHEFTMAVDARESVDGYDLGRTKKPHKGVRIEMDLYEPLTFTEMAAFDAELKNLVKFSIIPVIYNGKDITSDPSKMKWDVENDDAWFKLDDSIQLKIYSQGLFVQNMYSHRYGKGGIVITKPGKALAQNMARNDLLTTDCEVWKRVDKQLRTLSKTHQEKAKTGGVMNEAMRTSLALKALNDYSLDALDILYATPLFTLTNGKHVRLQQLLGTGFVAGAPSRDRAADLLMQRRQAMVIAPQTLHRFGVENVVELHEKLSHAIARHAILQPSPQFTGDHAEWNLARKRYMYLADTRPLFEAAVFKNTVEELPMRADIKFDEVRPNELTADEKVLMGSIRKELFPRLSWLVRSHLNDQKERQSNTAERALAVAMGEGFLGCTDGSTRIWLERKFLKKCIHDGLQGFVAIANVLVHELLHDADSSTGHDHDHEFFQAYHDLTLQGNISQMAMGTYRHFLRNGGKAVQVRIKQMEEAGFFSPDEGMERLNALNGAPAVEEDLPIAACPTPAAPKRRRMK